MPRTAREESFATTPGLLLLAGMKKMTKTSQKNRTNLNLAKETLRTLNSDALGVVQGGLMRTTFSCVNLCISINAC
jgi:hypothetical protein